MLRDVSSASASEASPVAQALPLTIRSSCEAARLSAARSDLLVRLTVVAGIVLASPLRQFRSSRTVSRLTGFDRSDGGRWRFRRVALLEPAPRAARSAA